MGFYGFKPLLLDLIHRRNVERAPELVGSETEIPPPAGGKIHELDLVPHKEFVVVRIRLFASSSIDGKDGMPVYLIVAGDKTALTFGAREGLRRPNLAINAPSVPATAAERG